MAVTLLFKNMSQISKIEPNSIEILIHFEIFLSA